MTTARALGALGRVMVTAGTLILLFVAYQLWGTGIHTSRAQDNYEEELEAAIDELPSAPDPRPQPSTEPQAIPHAPPRGGWIANIRIPAIGVDWIFLEGVGLDVLANGPGHYEGTPLPGQSGNAGIAGHRTTYGAPFHRLDELGEGDRIYITYPNGSQFVYRYLATRIVRPDQTDVLQYKFDDRLTLTACNPKYSAAERIVVAAELLDRPAPGSPPPDAGAAIDDAESIDGQSHPKTPAVVWGIAAAMVWLAAWAVGRAWRRWPAYAIGLPIFLVVLYGFFENFSYALPSSY